MKNLIQTWREKRVKRLWRKYNKLTVLIKEVEEYLRKYEKHPNKIDYMDIYLSKSLLENKLKKIQERAIRLQAKLNS